MDTSASSACSGGADDPAIPLARHPRLRKLLHHLEANPRHQLTTTAAARIVCFQQNYFCTLFRQVTGRTFSNWQRGWRVTRIAAVLISEDIPITHAAERYGYLNMRTFERAFKAQYRTTAREFRRRHDVQCQEAEEGRLELGALGLAESGWCDVHAVTIHTSG